jgi:hypothetical protein
MEKDKSIISYTNGYRNVIQAMLYHGYPKTFPRHWWVDVQIPTHVLRSDNPGWKPQPGRFVSFQLEFMLESRDPCMGIYESDIAFTGQWALPEVGNYPDYVKDAVNRHLKEINLKRVFAVLAVRKVNAYINSLYTQ